MDCTITGLETSILILILPRLLEKNFIAPARERKQRRVHRYAVLNYRWKHLKDYNEFFGSKQFLCRSTQIQNQLKIRQK
ncbi:MAG: hypothetical protein ONB46_16320 [candidate division KSB1 bacterium]|nr:hypothetical protein [candidate division KSB1 bacterium]MDZ7367277.1 hypothetical protein [candidate division KSB1 bacterium]MDZ7405884.1 hypothetical protein [candidate division KSB1 bacterium]